MKRRGIPITLDLVGLLVVALLVREWFRPAEPVYQGRPVSAWIEALGVQEGNSRQMQAAWSVGGIASLGGLISTPIGVSLAPGSVVTRSSGGGVVITRTNLAATPLSSKTPRYVPTIAALNDPDVLVRANAANALAIYGPQASAAVPKLSEMFKTKDGIERYCSGRALTLINAAAAARLGVK